mmetsp:Transcript_98642/g.318094  ORF Transcript_98642/g.318094 Transcript_98642/m.318094 type:complete len:1066 (-) Transcript_98642:431-3628(-)
MSLSAFASASHMEQALAGNGAAATSNNGTRTPQCSPSKGRVFVMMGPPASGKGTQCRLLAKRLGFVHLSTGDVFRDLVQRGTELGMRAKQFLENNCFVPDDMVVSLVQARLSQPDVQERGCLLDSFPRTTDQTEALLRHVNIDGVFFLQAPDKALIARAADRRIDPVTGDIYHLKFLPPPAEVASRVVRRNGDDEHSFRRRIEVFHGCRRRVLPLFSGQVHKIDATLEPAEVYQSILRSLQKICCAGPDANGSNPVQVVPVHSCAICYEELANFLVVPCGHQCGCEECLTAVQHRSGRCPICRAPVQAIQRVFRCGIGAEAEQVAKRKLAMEDVSMHLDLDDKLDEQAKVAGMDVDDDEWSDDGEVEQQEAVFVVAAPCRDLGSEGCEVPVMVSAKVPESAMRAPADICCVIDISGSMGAPATYETEYGKVQDDGLSVLDIVKHATKTVLKALQDGDRLALVAFNDKAHTVLDLTAMTTQGQEEALEVLDNLSPNYETNIWGGILAAMEALRAGCADPTMANRQRAILLLTDGQPNLRPPRGHVTELRDYMDTHPNFTCQLNTFGFGYNLDSELLLALAKEGNGTYAFIPDAVIVGTTFVNSVANLLSTLSQCATLNLMPRGGAVFTGPVLGGFAEQNESWGKAVSLGPLQYGQSREVVVPLRMPPFSADSHPSCQPYLEIVLTYPRASGSVGRVCATAKDRTSTADAVVALCRADAVTTGNFAIQSASKNEGQHAVQAVKQLCARLETSTAALSRSIGAGETDGRLSALQGDTDGRMSKALRGKDRFNRWGKHYLRALMRSHQLQVCTNFMDPGLQPYGGALFRSLREVGDQIFLSLPPPARRAVTTTNCSASASTTTTTPAPNMTTYYAGAGGGCFAPSSIVRRIDEVGCEQPIAIRHVRAGDSVRVADGGVALVRCVAEIARGRCKQIAALPSGLRITPRHPVRIDGRWQLPQDLADVCLSACSEGCVFNVLLDRCHVVMVDDVECATWGHGLEGDVIGHPFFGTDRVVDALSALPGWGEGFVQVKGTWRDADASVIGFHGAGLNLHESSGFSTSGFLASSL